MRVHFLLFLEGINGRHIEMPIEAVCLEDLDKTIARNWKDYRILRSKISEYNHHYYMSNTQYPKIKMVVRDNRHQYTEIYDVIYESINKKQILSKTKEIMECNVRERYAGNCIKQGIAKDIIYMVSRDNGDFTYELIRKLYSPLKRLGELSLDNEIDDELVFDKSKYDSIINGFESYRLMCVNKSEFPYVYGLKEKLKMLINKKNILDSDIIEADNIVEEMMNYCNWVYMSSFKKIKNK